jgi:hypothetical protein
MELLPACRYITRENEMKQSQNQMIFTWLDKGHSLTQDQAKKRFGVGCLHSRITELRKIIKGSSWSIRTDMIPVKNRYGKVCHVAKYTMTNSAEK